MEKLRYGEYKAGRGEQPEGVQNYIVSLLVTTLVTSALYRSASQRIGATGPLCDNSRPPSAKLPVLLAGDLIVRRGRTNQHDACEQ